MTAALSPAGVRVDRRVVRQTVKVGAGGTAKKGQK